MVEQIVLPNRTILNKYKETDNFIVLQFDKYMKLINPYFKFYNYLEAKDAFDSIELASTGDYALLVFMPKEDYGEESKVMIKKCLQAD